MAGTHSVPMQSDPGSQGVDVEVVQLASQTEAVMVSTQDFAPGVHVHGPLDDDVLGEVADELFVSPGPLGPVTPWLEPTPFPPLPPPPFMTDDAQSTAHRESAKQAREPSRVIFTWSLRASIYSRFVVGVVS